MAFRIDLDSLTEQLIIEAFRDQAEGTPSNDTATGQTIQLDTDITVESGNDDLINLDLSNTSQLQVDFLITSSLANDTKDTFILGDSKQPYYAKDGSNDFATILGFDSKEDIIQLHGSSQDYRLSQSISGTEIFLQQGTQSELIAFLPFVYDLNLSNSYFQFEV